MFMQDNSNNLLIISAETAEKISFLINYICHHQHFLPCPYYSKKGYRTFYIQWNMQEEDKKSKEQK